MKIRKTRIETVSETSTLLMLKRHHAALPSDWCEQCSAEVLWIRPDLMRLMGISDLPEIDRVHTRGDEICSRSLIARLDKEKGNG